MTFFASRKFLAICLLLGVALRLLFIVVVPSQQVYDNAQYLEFASRISQGAGYTLNGRPTAYWSGGYPMTLGMLFFLTGPSLLAAQLLNIGAAMASILLVNKIALRLSGDAAIAGIASGLMAIFPTLIASASVTMSEELYLTAMLGGVCLMISGSGWLSAILAGGFFGYATFLRSPAAVLPAFFFLAYLVFGGYRGYLRKHAARTLVILAVAAAATIPWMIRNQTTVGAFVLSTNGQFMFAAGNNPMATGKYMHASVFASSLGLPELARDYDSMPEVGRGKQLGEASLAWALANPLKVVKLWPTKLWVTFRSGLGIVNWIYDGIDVGNNRGRTVYNVFQFIAQGYYVLLWVATAIWIIPGVWRYRKDESPSVDPISIVALAALAHTSLMVMVFFGNARYGVPIYPFLCIAGGATVASFIRARLNKSVG